MVAGERDGYEEQVFTASFSQAHNGVFSGRAKPRLRTHLDEALLGSKFSGEMTDILKNIIIELRNYRFRNTKILKILIIVFVM